MKITRNKNIFRSIRSTLNRFLSILFIVALGAGFMAGLAATSPDMYATADDYMDKYSWYDIAVKATLGFTDDDVELVSELAGVAEIAPSVVFDAVLDREGGKTATARVFGILDATGHTGLNGFELIEGRLPQRDGECVIQSGDGKYLNDAPKVGETLRVSKEDSGYETVSEYLTVEEFSVVGIVRGPMCISIIGESTNVGNGTIGLDVYVPETTFDTEFYTDLFILAEGAKPLDTFSEEYEELVGRVSDRIKAVADIRAAVRTAEIRDEIGAAADSLARLLDIVKQLTEEEKQLAEAAGYGAAVNAKIAEMYLQNPEFAVKLAEISKQTEQRLKEMADESDSDDYTDYLSELLEEAERQQDEMTDGLWLVRERADSLGFDSYSSNVGKVAALSKIFPVFFFVVALLVALTTMTRLVEEKREEIGTLKALGFSNGQILSEYMLYSLSASVLGCVLGFSVGFAVFPKAISSAYAMMFYLPKTLTPFRWNIVAWVAPVTISSILLATLWACFDEFRSCPAQLMVPKAPMAGKRIWLEKIPFIWKRISFTYKVTFRNLFRYKKRFFMTIIGVSGCTALLLTGFGVRDSVNDIVDKQFGEVYRYELTVACDSADVPLEDETLKAFLTDTSVISDYMRYAQENGRVLSNDDYGRVTIVIPEFAEKSGDFIRLRERKSGETVDFPKRDEVVLTEKLCEQLHVKTGDKVTVENADGRTKELTVSGITENYVTSYAYMTKETYEAAFDKDAELSMVLCCLEGEPDSDEVTTRALESSRVIYSSSSLTLKKSFADSIKSINGVVWVLIFAAGLLSVVVLYNLNNVNICERRKELATIRVLGFHVRETQNYVFRESNLLTLLGSFVGLFLGIWLHAVVVRTVEVDQVMFGRNIYPLSFVYAIAISMVFSMLVNLIMKRTIKKIDMVEAMKAND